jgi:hypothetical protein
MKERTLLNVALVENQTITPYLVLYENKVFQG